MKKMKKIFAALLTLAMVLGMSLTAFAAETTNVVVKVSNVEEADLYVAQIVKADTGSTDGWAYMDDYKNAFASFDIGDLLAVVTNIESGSASGGTLTSSSDLAGVLENIRENVQIPANKILGDSFTATSGGLYVVVPVKENWTYSPTLVYVPVNSTDNVTVQTKGESDEILKEIDGEGESVSAGDIIQYTVKIKYPYISASYANPSFKISDTLTNATFFVDAEHQIEISGIPADAYTCENPHETTELEIAVNSYDSTKAGTQITITYWVKVDEDVSSNDVLKNKATYELKLTPDGTPIKTEYIVISTPVKAEIEKVDANKQDKKLEGAVFALYKGKTTDPNAELISIMADAVNTTGITLPSAYADNEDLLKADGTKDGLIKFDGLDAQEDYYVVEVIAPDGYSVDDTKHQLVAGTANEPIKGTVTTTNPDGSKTITTTTTYTFGDFTVNGTNNKITNDTLSALPETGGIGTTIFTIGGCVIMIAAAGLFFASRRKESK